MRNEIKNVKKDKEFEKVAIYQWRIKQSIGWASFLSYLRINSGAETLRAAANDTENDILFRGVNRRKNRSSLARLHEYFIGASTAK